MLRNFLRAKIHGATVTEANVDYAGSLAIDEELMRLAGIAENEAIQVASLTSGERLTTYAIPAPAGSGAICSNGAAARKIGPGDRVIVFAFGLFTEEELKNHEPSVVFVDESNRPAPGPVHETFVGSAPVEAGE